MTWKEEVRDQLIQYQEANDTTEFRLHAFYAFAEDDLSAEYPNNNHVRAKIRQVLQQLRDQGEIRFVDNQGTYARSGHSSETEEEEEEEGGDADITILEGLESEFDDI